MGVHAWGQNEIDLTTAHGLLTATATAPYQALIEIDYVANAFEVDEMKHYVGFNNILSFNNIHHTHAARVTAVQRYPDGGQLGFARSPARAMHPHGGASYVRMSRRS